MKSLTKIKESIRFRICVIAMTIAVIGMMIAVATSEEEEILRNIFVLVVNSITLMLVIIEHLKYVVQQRSEKEQELKPDTNDKLNSDI